MEHIHFREIDSTNAYMRRLGDMGLGHLSVVSASYQTAGRGQRNHIWGSYPAKNLLLSMNYLASHAEVNNPFLLNKLVAVSICEWLERWRIKASIKWPNDIMCQDLKIAGLLIENTLQGGYLRRSVIGMGINVNQTQFPSGWGAVSMCTLTGITYELPPLLRDFIAFLRQQMARGVIDVSLLNRLYAKRLWKRGVMLQFRLANGDIIEGAPHDIDDYGRLIADTSLGRKVFDFGEVAYRPAAK